MKIIRLGATLALALAALFAGCAKKDTVKYLVMGTNAEFPPFVSRAEPGGPAAGEIVGFDVEVALAIADKVGLPLKVENMEFDRLLPALAAGEVDLVLAALPITEPRRRIVNFSTPYYNATPVAAILAGGPVPESKDELKGMKIGAQVGTADLEAAQEIAGESAKGYPTAAEAVASLLANQVECVILDDQLVPRFTAQNELLMRLDIPFDPELYGVAVKKGNAELLAKVNETLAEIVADGRYDKWLDQWLIGPAPAAE